MVHLHASVRDRRRAETRERFVAAAERLLIDEGLEALTMQRLAQELGYAVGAAYRYFASKDAVLAAVQGRCVAAVHQDLRAGQALADATLGRSRVDEATAALTRLLVLSQDYASLPERRPAEYLLICRVLGDPRPLAETEFAKANMLPPVLELLAMVGALFAAAEAVEALGGGEAEHRAAVLWGSIHGVTQLQKLERFGVPAYVHAKLTSSTAVTLLTGWGADPQQLEAARKRARRLRRREESP